MLQAQETKIIYDVGANNGDDIPYYLLKADKVIVIEANPHLCQEMESRFFNDIATGHLIIENCIVTTEESSPKKAFYIHRTNHVLSQFPAPLADVAEAFECVYLPAINIIDILKKHGNPYYIKIDIEHYDHILLRYLFENKIFPPYISAEAHTADVFCLMVVLGGYNAFKLVDGATVDKKYNNLQFDTNQGKKTYSFPHHAAGPFGNDIKGMWFDKNNFTVLLGLLGLGWKDIHASSIDFADPQHNSNPQFEVVLRLDY